MSDGKRHCGYCGQAHLVDDLQAHVDSCWPWASQRAELFIVVEGKNWKLAAWEPRGVTVSAPTGYVRKEVSMGGTQRESWQKYIEDAVNLNEDGLYPLPRRIGALVLLDVMGLLSYSHPT